MSPIYTGKRHCGDDLRFQMPVGKDMWQHLKLWQQLVAQLELAAQFMKAHSHVWPGLSLLHPPARRWAPRRAPSAEPELWRHQTG